MPLSGYTRMGAWQPKRLRYGASTKGQRVAGRFPESSCHGRRPWWNGMENLRRMPPRMGTWQPKRPRYGASTKGQRVADGLPERKRRRARDQRGMVPEVGLEPTRPVKCAGF